MRVLYCEQCGDIIKPGGEGLKYIDLYFCSYECLNKHISWDIYPIKPFDFEQNGVQTDQDVQDEENEIVNDYDIQMGYAND